MNVANNTYECDIPEELFSLRLTDNINETVSDQDKTITPTHADNHFWLVHLKTVKYCL